jgi:hypothetical protein
MSRVSPFRVFHLSARLRCRRASDHLIMMVDLNYVEGSARSEQPVSYSAGGGGKLPPFSGSNLENMALVLYGPAASKYLTQQYYIPVCLPPGTAVYNSVTSTYTCVGRTWQWR